MVSIIIPVYNVETYLRQCLDSVLAQTLKDIEVIVVDDGSTDNSPAICDEYAARDTRVKVIHQSNAGRSAARNAALKVARGEYIGFVDSDDWIDPLMYEYMLEKITRTQSDIAVCGYFFEYTYGSRVKEPVPAPAVYHRSEALKMLIEDRLVQSLSCDKLFRREVIGDFYPEGRDFYEDSAVMLRWFSRAERFAIDATPFYHYRMRRSGVVNSTDPATYFDKLTADIERYRFIVDNLPPLFTESHLSAMIIESAVIAAKKIARYCLSDPDSYDYFYRIREASRPFLEMAVPSLRPKTLKRYITLLNSIPSFCRKVRLSYIFEFASRRKTRGCFP